MGAPASLLRRPGDPLEHREGVGLGVRGKAANEQDGNGIVGDVQRRPLCGPLRGGRGPEAVRVDAERNQLQPGPQGRSAAVSVAEVIGIGSGDGPHHAKVGGRGADQGVVRLVGCGDHLGEDPGGTGRAEGVRDSRQCEGSGRSVVACPGESGVRRTGSVQHAGRGGGEQTTRKVGHRHQAQGPSST